jgi:hypothetical protein
MPMSYGIDFMRREPSGDDDLDDPELHRPVRSSPHLRARVLAEMAAAKEFDVPGGGKVITDTDSYVQVFYSDDGVGLSVTYGDSPNARQRIDLMYRLAAIVEEETGLIGWDTQVGQRISAVHEDLRRQSYDYGVAATEQIIAKVVEAAPRPATPPKARRFRFWDRRCR